MIRTWRVATREYLENTKTKGFWLGILMFPLMIVIFSQVPQFLEDRATPTRHFVLIDRSDEFGTFV
jgi:ABC-2 type transport system permease protein